MYFKFSFCIGWRGILTLKKIKSASLFRVLRLHTYFPGICEERGLNEEKRETVPKKWLFTCSFLGMKEFLAKK